MIDLNEIDHLILLFLRNTQVILNLDLIVPTENSYRRT